MDGPSILITEIRREDELLRQLLTACSAEQLEGSLPGGALNPKEILGHIAFWDRFAVDFFEQKLDADTPTPQPPANFDRLSNEELERIRSESYTEVLDHYEVATAGLIAFLRLFWGRLSSTQQLDFSVPLKHRRHHRLLLERALGKGAVEPTSREMQQNG